MSSLVGSSLTYIIDTWPRKVVKTTGTGSNTCLECIRNDLKVKGLEASLAQNRTVWRWTLYPKSRLGCDKEVVQPLDTGDNAR